LFDQLDGVQAALPPFIALRAASEGLVVAGIKDPIPFLAVVSLDLEVSVHVIWLELVFGLTREKVVDFL
jgi:hypothetical protein